jgi:TonB-linked SusC/RagA family outer membrane protein
MRSKYKWILTLLVAFSVQFSFAQEKTITGIVSDGSGPLPGVNVVVKGTTRGISTGFDGKYSIKAKVGETIVYSFLGMNDITRVVGSETTLNIIMRENAQELEAVVVTALGIKKREDAITSTNQVVKTKELTQAANPNAIQSLAGKVSGVQINTTTNGVNPDTRIVIRGNRSITGNNQALIVIDGAISTSAVLGQLPPETIESMNIVKGQQGGALYGDQGSNGVIIVTTKKGSKSSKLSVTLNSAADFQEISFLPARQTQYGQGWGFGYDFDFPDATDPRNNSIQFSPIENGAWGVSFNDPNFAGTLVPTGLPQADGKFILSKWESRGSDNIKDFFRTGIILQNGITLNAGNEDGYALFNASRQTTDFVVQDDQLARNSFLFKAGKKLNKFSIDASISYINQSISQTDNTLYQDLLQTPTNVDVSKYKNSGNIGHWTVYARNPFQVIKQIRLDDKSDVFNGVINLGYQLNKNISVSNTANIQTRYLASTSHNDGFQDVDHPYDIAPYQDSGNTTPTYSDFGGAAQADPSSFFISQSFSRNIYNDFIVNFDYNLSKDLNLKFNLGSNIQERFFRIGTQGGLDLDTPGYYYISNVLKPSNPATLDNFITKYRKIAFFGNLDLNYKDYLFLNATGRYEKASVIKDGYFYPSVGMSFIPTKAFESIKGDVFNYAKLYASYVVLGNSSSVDPYRTNNIGVNATGFPFGSLAGFGYNTRQANPNIKPEFIYTKEVGVSFAFFNDRLTLDASYYINDTKDLITNATISSAAGLRTNLDNTGKIENKGFEIDLGITPVRMANNGFTWNMRGNFTKYKSVVKELQPGVSSVNLQQPNTFIGIFAEVGEEFPLIKGTAFEKDPNGNIIVDANGTPKRTSEFVKLGKVNPDYIIGFTNTFSYKGISLTAVADFRTGGSVYSDAYNLLSFPGYLEESASQDRYKGYVVPNSVQQTSPGVYTTNTTPVNSNDSNGLYGGVLNYFSGIYNRTGEPSVLDATALKIKELALSYDLPKSMLTGTGVESFKFGINARNPFVYFFGDKNGTLNKGYTDPEASNTNGNAQGISDVGQYPSTRTYGFSLNVTF